MTQLITEKEGNIEARLDYDLIIARLSKIYSKNSLRFFDISDLDVKGDVSCQIISVDDPKCKLGMPILDYYGYDKKTSQLEHIGSYVAKESVMIDVNDNSICKIFALGYNVKVSLTPAAGPRSTKEGSSQENLADECVVYSEVTFEKANERKVKDDTGFLSDYCYMLAYNDGTQLLLRGGTDSMGDWYAFHIPSSKEVINSGYGTPELILNHQGILIMPLDILKGALGIMDSVSGEVKGAFSEMYSVAIDDLVISMGPDMDYSGCCHYDDFPVEIPNSSARHLSKIHKIYGQKVNKNDEII